MPNLRESFIHRRNCFWSLFSPFFSMYGNLNRPKSCTYWLICSSNLHRDPWINEAFWPMGSLWKWRPPLSLQEKIIVEKPGRGQPIRQVYYRSRLADAGWAHPKMRKTWSRGLHRWNHWSLWERPLNGHFMYGARPLSTYQDSFNVS